MNGKRLWIGIAVCVLAAAGARASTVIGLGVEDQARLSTYVVAGTVVDQVGIDDPENGIETIVRLEVADALKGKVGTGDVVEFRTRGGRVGDEVSEAVGEAVFHTGEKVLVFLEDIDGRLYNLGLSMGVWTEHEDRAGVVSYTRALQDGLEVFGDVEVEMGPITLRDMAGRVAFAARHPQFDHPLLRESRVEGR